MTDLSWLYEVGAVIGRAGSTPGVPTGHRLSAQGNALKGLSWIPNERFVFGLAWMWVSSKFCQPESINTDFAKAQAICPEGQFAGHRSPFCGIPFSETIDLIDYNTRQDGPDRND